MAQSIPVLTRRLEKTSGTSNKFWVIELHTDENETGWTVRKWGRIGTEGQQTIDQHYDYWDAYYFVRKHVREKEKRGYVEILEPVKAASKPKRRTKRVAEPKVEEPTPVTKKRRIIIE